MHSTSPHSSGREPLDNTTEAPPSKRLKIEDTAEESKSAPVEPSDSASVATKGTILPPSHSLLGTAPPLQDENGAIIRLMESDVGISDYIAKHVQKIGGIIKQRYALDLVLPKEGH
jgi:tRNA pseudouridine13 synthase